MTYEIIKIPDLIPLDFVRYGSLEFFTGLFQREGSLDSVTGMDNPGLGGPAKPILIEEVSGLEHEIIESGNQRVLWHYLNGYQTVLGIRQSGEGFWEMYRKHLINEAGTVTDSIRNMAGLVKDPERYRLLGFNRIEHFQPDERYQGGADKVLVVGSAQHILTAEGYRKREFKDLTVDLIVSPDADATVCDIGDKSVAYAQ
ncbi:MAG: hypothetical protein KJ709_04405 [Nanoarchaeota archaeon]|nr:hypothetical protein [Nanoarchaeota archaeon]